MKNIALSSDDHRLPSRHQVRSRNTKKSSPGVLRAPAAPLAPIVARGLVATDIISFPEFLKDAACREYCNLLFGGLETAAGTMLWEFSRATDFPDYYYGRPGQLTENASTRRVLKKFARRAYRGDPNKRGVEFWERIAWLVWNTYAGLMVLRCRAGKTRELELKRIADIPKKRTSRAAYMRRYRAKRDNERAEEARKYSLKRNRSATSPERKSEPASGDRSKSKKTIKTKKGEVQMNIESVAVRELRPYANNARTHSKKQIRQIANSIKKFGFCNPVLMDDQKQVIAGHGRVEAAKLLGIDAVPAVRLSHLSDADKRAYILADNKLAEKAGWDREILAIELQGLIELDYEVELTGFETPEIDLILEDQRDAKGSASGPEDEIPARASGTVVSQTGDLWLLGEHRLICGDARETSSYAALLQGEKAQFVFTDPPYNVKIEGNVCGLGRIHHDEFAMASGEMSQAQFTEFLEQVFHQLANNSLDGSIHDVCMDWRHMSEMLAAGHKVYNELKNVCVWNKTNAGMGTFYRSKYELVFLWKLGSAAHINNFELGQHGRHRTNVWDYAGVNTLQASRRDELALHPTVKPVALVADAIKDCSSRGALVLDPFCGSGTVLIAAERTGRKARALEIDAHYVDVAIRRWQTYSGKSAVLAATNQTFEEVEEQRAAMPMAA